MKRVHSQSCSLSVSRRSIGVKLPRWLMIAMLTSSVLATLAAAGWWWVTWPERTAAEFAAAMASENWDRAKEMMATVPTGGFQSVAAWDLLNPAQWDPANIEPEPRSLRDIREARQTFHLAKEWRMTVERDKVKMVGLQIILVDHDWPNIHLIRRSKNESMGRAN